MDTRVQTKPEFNLTRYHKNKLIFHCTLYLFINIYFPYHSHTALQTHFIYKNHILILTCLYYIKYCYHCIAVYQIYLKQLPLTCALNQNKYFYFIVKFQPWIETQIPQNCIIRYRYQKNIHHLGNLTLRLCFTRTYFILKEKNGLFKLFVLG